MPGVVAGPGERVQTRNIGKVGARRKARACDEVARANRTAIGIDLPFACLGVETRGGHARVEVDIPAQIQAVVNMRKVPP